MKYRVLIEQDEDGVFVDAGLPDADERAAIAEAIRRDKDLSSGRVAGRTQEEVMQAARRALEC
jgi:predicted RNase H-like HicB family nuclease